jgi:hypothetical protein
LVPENVASPALTKPMSARSREVEPVFEKPVMAAV